MKRKLVIATRKSPLALWQAETIRAALLKNNPDLSVDLLSMRTTADKFVNMPLQNIGGKGLFVKELEMALIEKQADLAVHSIKDLPAEMPEQLKLAVICERDDPRDVLICRDHSNLNALSAGAKVGTSSLRRQCQIKSIRKDLKLINLRGNVDTRLKKLEQNEFDAIVLAAAGLKRLNEDKKISQYFTIYEMIPAIGQGAIGIECRADDIDLQNIIAPLDHLPTRNCITAERAMNEEFGGNCQIPIAAHAFYKNNQLNIMGMVGSSISEAIVRGQRSGDSTQAAALGKALANDLINQGALALLGR